MKTEKLNDKNGTFVEYYSSIMGSQFKGARVLFADGVIRSVRIAKQADTWFSIPANVTIKKKSFSGYITFDDGVLNEKIPAGGAWTFRPHTEQACETLYWN